VKGVRTGGIGGDPKLETVLDIVINDGTSDLYGGSAGRKTVAEFFADSAGPDGIQLGTLASGGSRTYSFVVSFPSTVGNDFQGKSVVFDLTFGDGTEPTPTPTNTPTLTLTPTPTVSVTPTPTGTGNLCGDIKVDIHGNGSGSVNGVYIICQNNNVVWQSNNTRSTTTITSISSTGGNTITGNTNTSTSVLSGSTKTKTTVTAIGGKNTNKKKKK
jgi:hypothetical protein